MSHQTGFRRIQSYRQHPIHLQPFQILKFDEILTATKEMKGHQISGQDKEGGKR
jgi:hypothetical protein